MTIMTTTVALTSDSAGDSVVTVRVNGYLAGIEIIPGTVTPTDQWDLKVTTEAGFDVFTDIGIANNVIEFSVPVTGTYFKYPIAGTLTILGENMGDTKGAIVLIHMED